MRILIMMNRAGGGHISASQALSHQFQQMGHECEIIDMDRFSLGKVGLLTTSLYTPLITYSPKMYDGMATLSESKRRAKVLNHTISAFIRNKLGSYLKQNKFDIIVSVNPFYVGSVANLHKFFDPIPFGAVVVDLVSIHPIWTDSRLKFLSVPTAEAKRKAIEQGVPSEVVGQFGMPIRPQFLELQPTKEEARRQLSLPVDRSIILVGGSGGGAGNVAEIAKSLLMDPAGYHIVTIAGKNNLLFRKLTDLQEKYPSLTVYKHIDFMAQLMTACDAIVAKAGPNIITEAMVLQRPIVALATPLYQEQGNEQIVEQYHLGRAAQKPAEVPGLIRQVLAQPYAGQPFQSRDVNRDICQFILDKAQEATQTTAKPLSAV
jgi:processive 1,2-diacylglycerol beta-glucosyltransferase